MMVVRQNILSILMPKNVKLSYKNVSFHWATPEICLTRNICSKLRKQALTNNANELLRVNSTEK